MTDNKTERYMIIFNDVGLTIKGYYNEPMSFIQRKKILDRLYTLIHRELFEGVQSLEEQTTIASEVTAAPMPDNSTLPIEPKVKRTGKKRGRPKKNRRITQQDIDNDRDRIGATALKGAFTAEPNPDISNQPLNPEPIQEPKDLVYDNEEDNQYGEFKKKGLI